MTEPDLEYCGKILQRHDAELLGNFETRMVSEVKLYWIIYKQCMGQLDRKGTEDALTAWKHRWWELFGKRDGACRDTGTDNLQINHELSSCRWATTLHYY